MASRGSKSTITTTWRALARKSWTASLRVERAHEASGQVKAQETGELVSIWRRQIELPRYLRAVKGQARLVDALVEISRELGFSRTCVISGATVTKVLADRLVEALDAAIGPLAVLDNSQEQVERLAGDAELEAPDSVIAVGGGKTIDVAKSVCQRLDLPVIVVPTQLTADGIASPVSVVRAHSGAIESRRARLPIGVVVDFDVLARSPLEGARAGFGDLIANACAVRDWRLAAAAGHAPVDDFAALLAESASELVVATDVTSLRRAPLDEGFLHRLLDGLVLSGLAMEIAGSSRPCSGSEHLVSHAIDRLYPGLARHGEQVAFGAVLCSRFQEQDWRALASLIESAGMEKAVRGFGLSEQQVVAAVQAAPRTRPGRYTILDELELTDAALAPMVDEVLDQR
jgi:glycerol-1-phosphate dehydrogenase [NAD(P)+]